MRHSALRRAWGLVICLGAACGYVTGTTADASLGVSFYGTGPALPPVLVQLEVHTLHRSYLFVGGLVATPTHPQAFDPVGLQENDSLTAVVTLQTPQGVELARAVTGFRVQSHWTYGIGFQAGGIDPSSTGFCQQPPIKTAIPGFPGDTLFLWTSGLPEGAVC